VADLEARTAKIVVPADASLIERHFSTKGIAPFVAWLDREEGKDLMDAVLADAGLPRSHIASNDRWVSRAWQHRFQRALAARLYKEPELPPHNHALWQLWRKAAWAMLSDDQNTVLMAVLSALLSPGFALEQFPRFMTSYNATLTAAVGSAGAGRRQITFTPTNPEESVDSPTYWNIIGTLERLPTLWGLPDARLEVLESPFFEQSPSRRMVIDVRYEEPTHVRMKALGAVMALAGGLAASGLWWAGTSGLEMVLGATTAAFSAWALLENRWRRAAVASQVDEANQLVTNIRVQDKRYEELLQRSREVHRSLLASQKLSGYLPADLVDEILENPEIETTLGGRRTDAAVLFADLVGFTPRTEQRPPEQVVDELNLYFGYIDPAFERHRGVIDKRMGDGVMAVFVPDKSESEADVRLRAIQCGLDLLRSLAQCNEELLARGGEPMSARVGIAAGPLVQGTMGSPVKFEYTVIGDVVNTAARLEGQARDNHLVVPAAVFDALPDGAVIHGRAVDRRVVKVKGKTLSIEVVELLPA